MQVWFINPEEEILQASRRVQEQPCAYTILGINSWEVHTLPVLGPKFTFVLYNIHIVIARITMIIAFYITVFDNGELIFCWL